MPVECAGRLSTAVEGSCSDIIFGVFLPLLVDVPDAFKIFRLVDGDWFTGDLRKLLHKYLAARTVTSN